MPSEDESAALLEQYKEKHAARKTTLIGGQRQKLTIELVELEQQVRNALKHHPVPEPLGMEKLQSIADQMSALGFDFLAVRLTGQHLRHPTAVPFADLAHLREYLGPHLETSKELAAIPELHARKKIFGLF